MSDNIIKRVLILGSLAIVGIIAVQAYWLLKNWDIHDKEFDQSVTIALRNVAQALAKYNNPDVPKKNLILRTLLWVRVSIVIWNKLIVRSK